MRLKLKKFYKVKNQKAKLIEIIFSFFCLNGKKDMVKYIFRNQKGKFIKITNKNEIEGIED